MKEILRSCKALLFIPLVLLLSYTGTAQNTTLDFKIQIHEADTITGEYSWGVYVKPATGFADGANGTVTASGQVTILTNLSDTITNIQSVNGNWNPIYDVVRGPTEETSTAYFFIGLDDEGAGVPLEDGEETLLFTFQADKPCPDKLELIDNTSDPLNAPILAGNSNSIFNNPGMDLAVFNTNTGGIHNWQSNYAPGAASCEDCDMDGIPDGIEDTDGDGMYTMGVDSSDLCDACDPLGIKNYSAEIAGGDILKMCQPDVNNPDSAGLVVTTTGGIAPYTYYLGVTPDGDAKTTQSFSNLSSGDTFYVKPPKTTVYTLDSIVDALGCALDDPGKLLGSVTVVVEGPLTWDAGGNTPAPVTSCTLDTIFFDVDASNGGDGAAGAILYQWQVSTDNGSTYTDIVNGTPYSFADTDSLIISNPDGLHNNMYRAKVYTETCDTLTSNPATLMVEGPFEINASPTDATVCGEETHEMIAQTVNLGSGSIVRQWQVNDGTGWADVSNGGNYDGVTTDTLEIAPVSGGNISTLNDNWYRLKIAGSNGICTDILTDSAKLVVEGPITIDPANLPKDTSSCAGEVACFGVAVTNPGGGTLEYQWYMSTPAPAALNWVALSNDDNFSGVRTDSMCILDAEGLNGYRFEVRISTGECMEITTTDNSVDPAVLSVTESISFNTDPQSESICGSDQVLFISNVNSTDPGLMKQWQMSSDTGATWVDVTVDAIFSGVMTDTLTVSTDAAATTQPDTLDGRLFRMNVSGSLCDEVVSREAELEVHVIDTVGITDPIDQSACSGESAYFVIDVPYNRDTQELRYRWQILNPSTSVWTNLNPVGDYNGVTTERLSISDVNGFNGMVFRAAVFTSECDTIFTDEATLTVEGPYVFGPNDDGHPQDTIVCSGESAFFAADPVIDMNTLDPFGNVNQGASSTLTYAWVYNALGDYNNPDSVATATWAGTAGVTGADDVRLDIGDVTGLDGYAFWLEVRSTECAIPARSLPAILNIDGPLSVVLQPMDASNCSDQGATFTADIANAGYGGEQTIEYRWREKDAGTGIWRDLINDDIYNGASSDTLSIDVLYGLDGNEYALLATIAGCSFTSTDTVSLTEEGPITVNRNPADIITCSGETGFFSADVIDSTGNSTLQYVWQLSTNNGLDWGNLTNTAPYSTVNTDSMNIADVAGLHGYRYRLAITNASGSCDTVFSLPARVTAEGPVVFDPMGDQTVCENIGTQIDATIDLSVGATGAGIPILRWQESADGGSTFTDLSNTGIYDATSTNQLFLDSTLNIDGNEYRLSATTKECALVGTFFYSDTVVINTEPDTIGTCDFDLDGLINDIDFDDDNDGLMDTVEIYISTSSDPDDYVNQFNTDTDNDGITDSEEDADGDTINNGEETDDDDADGDSDDVDVFTGDPLDPCSPILSPSCIGVVLDVKVKLQGAMIGQPKQGLMRDDLRGLTGTDGFPTTEPYTGMKVNRLGNPTNQLAFVHVDDHQINPNKGGGEIAPASLLADQPVADNDIVDWVFVELRSGLQLDSIIATRAALLQRDGDIRDTEPRAAGQSDTTDIDGYHYLRFDSTLAGEYYVSVRHRNHLGVMTNEAGLLSPKVQTIDFIDPQLNALGVHPQRMIATTELRDSNGTMVYTDSLEQQMWAGDLNSDGKAIYQGGQNDVNEMFSNVITAPGNQTGGLPLDNYILPGYKRSDYNLDGRTIYQGPLNDRQMLIFNSILSFPDNQKLLANYVILEQLP